MAKLRVRDNQWWFKASPLPGDYQTSGEIVLRIEGRDCRMVRAARGSDGRETYSFKFVTAGDRALWVSLRGQEVDAEVVSSGDASDALELGYGDDERLEESDEPERAAPGPSRDRSPASAGVRVTRSGPTDFDAYVFVDYSANSTPKRGKDSLWIADAHFDASGELREAVHNPDTRAAAHRALEELLAGHRRQGRRVLVGVDFPLAYPSEGTRRLFPEAPSWRALWSYLVTQIKDGDRNENNRFEVAAALNAKLGAPAFWGCPVARASDRLRPTKAAGRPVPEYRAVERRLRAAGKGAFSVWQLYGNGSVGSQALVGIPRVHALRRRPDLGGALWPFETGFALPERGAASGVVWAEIWPGCVPYDGSLHPTRDAAQMLGLARWAASHDAAGTLRRLFEVPALVGPERDVAATEEGWILGFEG